MKIESHVPLADKNWFKTGGKARFFAEPKTEQEFQQALIFAHKENIPLFILGHGANLLFSDNGFDGLVIRPALRSIQHTSQNDGSALVTAEAGCSINDVIEYCLNHNLLGLEEFSGIPGTIGGALYINLHYFEFLIEQFVEQATVIERSTGKLTTVVPTWFQFGYNASRLEKEHEYLVNATFKVREILDPLAIAYARGRKAEIIRHRERRYPAGGTCGSFFRNFHEDELHDKTGKTPVKFVAYYLDKAGVRGSLRKGTAMVSHQHANMLVSQGIHPQSADIISVAREMQRRVYDMFGILPEPECRLVGFNSYPLYTSTTISSSPLACQSNPAQAVETERGSF